MKKKLILALLSLLAVSILASSACALKYDREHPPKAGERARRVLFDVLNSAKHPVFLKYRAQMENDDGKKEDTVVTLAIKGDLTFVDLDSKSRHLGTIYDGKSLTTTVIMHDEKMYMAIKDGPVKIPAAGEIGRPEEGERAKYAAASGAEKIKGSEYEYDRLKWEDGGEQTFYFTPWTDDWKWWRVQDGLLEILAYGGTVDDKLFKVPAGYQEMKMPVM